MAAYDYVALDTSGKEKKGVLEADTARLARSLLRSQNLTPLEVSESSAKAKLSNTGSSSTSFRGSISTAELSLITRQIATLTASGTPIEEALTAVSQHSEKQKIKSLILSVRAKVLEGHSLAAAMRDYPKVFPEIYQATVSAGEQSGHLDAVLERLAEYLENRQSTQATVKKALIYPSMLVIASVGIVAFLLGYVVPQVVQVFDSMNQELPWLTKTMLALSAVVREWGLIIALSLVVAYILFSRAMTNEKFKYRVHSFQLRLPIIGRLIRGFNASQFARTLSILAASGVPVLQALDIASQVISNRPMRAAVNTAASQVREGATLSGSLQKTGYFPPMMLHLLASGEASGQLDSMLEKAATHQEREVDSLISLFLGLFEPVIILIMGGAVLAIVLAILLPIFQMNQLVS